MDQPRARLLILTPQLPYPPRQGTSIRNYNLIRYLARNNDVDLVTFLAPGDLLEADSPLHTLCGQIDYMPQPDRTMSDRLHDTFFSPHPDMALRLFSDDMVALVAELPVSNYDIIQFEGIEMAPYGHQIKEMLDDKMTSSADSPLLVFDNHNCEYLLQQRNAQTDLRMPKRWPAASYSLIQTQKLRRYEKRSCDAVDLVVSVSDPDKKALQKLGTHTPIVTIPNGVDCEAYVDLSANRHPPDSDFATIVFTGKMDYRPNIDAALWFGNHVFPVVQMASPNARFQIVGQQPHARLDALRNNADIQITGAVPEILPYLANAAVFVIPMRVGGGTRLKALEAMAAGLPIVATSMGIEGIDVQDGRELLIRDEPAEFAQAIHTLLEDHAQGGELNRQLGIAARKFVQDNYDWSRIVPALEDAYGIR